MDPSQNAGPGFWKYMINPDKSASPQLEQLCLGIAKIIPSLDPGPDSELTPPRLAAFYRAVGGDYDALLLGSSDHALSFMFQTLGCFHSLQQGNSPFEAPRIPCLTAKGFARWQTIQLLLCPEENVPFMQKAVQLWNVPMPNGGFFPKYMPKEVFPDRPDEEMEKWHKMVTAKLNQQNYHMRRIKNSPYQSPHPEPYDRRDGYFSSGPLGKPTRRSRSSSRDRHDPRAALYRRRSSVPDFPSPSGERGLNWDARTHEDQRKARSHSAQRPVPPPSRQRSHTTTGPPANSYHKDSSNSPPSRRRSAVPPDQSGRRSSGYNTQYRSPARTPSTVDEDTGSEASSETSQMARRQRASDEERKSRRPSLWVPSFMRSHKRRHSSDASYRASGSGHKPPPPLRPEYYPPRAIKPSPQPQPSPYRVGGAPQFRETVWDAESASSQQPTPTPAHAQAQVDPRVPGIRFPEQPNFEPLTRESSSGSGTDQRHRSSDWERGGTQRRAGHTRFTTLTGVHGRKYPTSDPMSPVNIERQRTHPSSRGGVAAAV